MSDINVGEGSCRGDSRDEAAVSRFPCRARRQRRPGLSAVFLGLEDLGCDTLWVGDRLVTPVDGDSSWLAHGPHMTRSLDPVQLCPSPGRRPAGCASTLSTFYCEPPHLAP